MTPETKLDQLLNSTADRSLDGLEDAVWSRLAAQTADERRWSRVATMQIGLFLAAVLGSAAVGGLAANQALARSADLNVFSPHSALTPSTRLIGGGQ